MLIYVTGCSGSGKSTVCAELRARGYDAHDSDFGISGWWHRTRRVEVPAPEGEDYRTEAWYAEHEWRFSRASSAELALQSQGGVSFLCGCAAGEDAVWPLFDRVFYLHADEATLRRRLAARTNNQFGKAPINWSGCWRSTLPPWSHIAATGPRCSTAPSRSARSWANC